MLPQILVRLTDPESDKTIGERHDSDVRAIASNSYVLDLLGKLYGRPAFPFQTLNFPRLA